MTPGGSARGIRVICRFLVLSGARTVHGDRVGDLDWMLEPQRDIETVRTLAHPIVHARREGKRQFINGLKRQALTDLIPVLPPPDTDLYIVSNGAGAEKRWTPGGIAEDAFDFGTFIPHIVEQLGNVGCVAYVSTWTMNRNHALSMIDMLTDGRLARLTVMTDPYFKRRESAVAAELITGLAQFPERGRFLAFKNHVKSICIATRDESQTCVVTGSANLSAQPRCEQYVLTTDPAVYRFFRDDFFGAMTDG